MTSQPSAWAMGEAVKFGTYFDFDAKSEQVLEHAIALDAAFRRGVEVSAKFCESNVYSQSSHGADKWMEAHRDRFLIHDGVRYAKAIRALEPSLTSG